MEKLLEIVFNIFESYKEYKAKRVVSGEVETAWKNVRKIWGKAKTVYGGAVGFAAIIPFEQVILQKFISQHRAEPLLVEALLDDNPYVVAYSLIALFYLKSSVFNRLPSQLLARNDIVNSATGCLFSKCSLSALALEYSSYYKVWLENSTANT